ncbi:glycoside hydrolase family 43 protein [Pedobacter sp.]|uniref:glycoside hydrolase family 43 protein n=1 Tax=Pedobacter sp. TaxID=1411316 RepID=UPI0031DB1917
MKRIITLLIIVLGFYHGADAQGYKNPVISGFHPDPSVCRVGDDYYLVTSSFEYFPGVPVFHSKDLINWTKIGHCLTRPSQLKLDKCAPSAGIYAPTIRYHEGRFYMVTTNVSGGGNFYVHTDNPAGEWSEPVFVEQGGIDPTLYFEGGKNYFISNGEGITISEIDLKTGKRLTESKIVWKGTGGRYPESPHLYKKDGWYYLLISEGGTEYGHKMTIARSRSIYGPYDPNPSNPILTHINENAQSNPIQGTGHGDFVQAHDGSWWVVFLGFRPQSLLHHVLGRETFLAPVRWDVNAWPVINGNGTVDIDMNVPTLPLKPVKQPDYSTNFNENKLSVNWNYLRNPFMENYSLTEKKGSLRLKASPVSLDDHDSPTFVGRRQEHINFTATASLSLNDAVEGDEAGMTAYYSPQAHYDVFLKKSNNGKYKVSLNYKMGALDHVAQEVEIPGDHAYLQVKGDKDFYSFYYSVDGKEFKFLSKINIWYLSSETNGGFTGVLIGLYAQSKNKNTKAYGDFDEFIYKPAL